MLKNPPSGPGLVFWDDSEVGLDMLVGLLIFWDDIRAVVVLGEYIDDEYCSCS